MHVEGLVQKMLAAPNRLQKSTFDPAHSNSDILDNLTVFRIDTEEEDQIT